VYLGLACVFPLFDENWSVVVACNCCTVWIVRKIWCFGLEFAVWVSFMYVDVWKSREERPLKIVFFSSLGAIEMKIGWLSKCLMILSICLRFYFYWKYRQDACSLRLKSSGLSKCYGNDALLGVAYYGRIWTGFPSNQLPIKNNGSLFKLWDIVFKM